MKNYETLKPGTLLCPTPVVLVSCAEKNQPEMKNLLAVAWVGTVNSDPPMVSVSIRPDRFSHHMILESGEFVVNLPDRSHAKATDFCGVRSGREMDKAAACGLRYRPAEGLEIAPALDDLPMSLNCKVVQRLPLGSHDMFIGEIVAVQVREDLLDPSGSVHMEKAGLICSNHGLYQQLGPVLGFFGYSVAKKDVYERRMKAYR